MIKSKILADTDLDANTVYDKYFTKMPYVYETVFRAWAKLYNMVCSGTNVSGSSFYGPLLPDLCAETLFKEDYKTLGKANQHYRAYSDGVVETGITVPDIQFRLAYTSDAEHPVPAEKRITETLSQIFPDFSVPVEWKASHQNSILRINPKLSFQDSALLPISTIEKLRNPPEANPKYDFKPSIYYKDFAKLFRGQVFMQLEAVPKSFVFQPRFPADKLSLGSQGYLKGMAGMLSGTIKVHCQILWPLEYALWATDVLDATDLIPKVFVNLKNDQARYYCDTAKSAYAQVGNLETIKEDNRATCLNFKYTPEITTNAENFTILHSGSVAWVPDVDNIATYYSLLRSGYSEEAFVCQTNQSIKGLTNLPVYTDWFNAKFSYVNGEGNFSVIDLSGSTPLDDITIHRYLSRKITNVPEDVWNVVISVAESQKFYTPKPGTRGTMASVPAMIKAMQEFKKVPVMIAALGGSQDKAFQAVHYDWLVDCCRELAVVVRKVLSVYDYIDVPLTLKTGCLRFYLELMTTYAKKYEAYRDNFIHHLTKNQPSNIDVYDDSVEIRVPNMPGLNTLMPHQAQILAASSSFPEATQYDVDPGGGKTITYLTQLLRLSAEYPEKLKMVICPSGLVGSVVTEINTVGQDKINAFPLKQSTLTHLTDPAYLGLTPMQLVQYIRSVPPNTVFVTSYEFIRSPYSALTGLKSGTLSYGTVEVPVYPNAQLLRMIGFFAVVVDEAQRGKNKDSSVNSSLSHVTVGAKYNIQASGSLIHNTSADMLGELSCINPGILGSRRQFTGDYGSGISVGNNIVLGQADIDRIEQVKQAYLMSFRFSSSAWSFLLPQPREQFLTGALTEKQSKFYELLLQEAMVKVEEKIGKDRLNNPSSDEDEAKIERALRTFLPRVEMFLVAPDRDKDYVRWEEEPQGADLISPKVAIIDQIIEAHFGGADTGLGIFADPNNKIIISAINICGADHIYEHMRRKSQALLYHAGDEAVLERFKADPTCKILVAAETSIREGVNMQYVSRIVRTQPPWSPGDVSQFLRRIFRPDPRNQYNRDQIAMDWVILNRADGGPTLDCAKVGRLIAKIIEKARIDYNRNADWQGIRQTFASLQLIRMTLDNIYGFTYAMLEQYFDAYQRITEWESQQFNAMRDRLATRLAKKYGRTIPLEEVKSLAMVPVVHALDIPGSRRTYVPYVPGGAIHDRFGIGLSPLSTFEYSPDSDSDSAFEDEGDSAINEAPAITVGMPVVTEFGVGTVNTVLKASVKVAVSGFKQVTLPKSLVYSTKDTAGLKILLQQARSLVGDPELQVMNIKPPKPEVPPSLLEPTPDAEGFEDEETPERGPEPTLPEQPFYTAVINNQPIIYAYADNTALNHQLLSSGEGWRLVPRFYGVQAQTYSGMVLLFNMLQRNYRIDHNLLADMLKIAKHLQGDDGHLQQQGPVDLSGLRNFMRLQHKELPASKPPIVRPWLMLWDYEAYICFNGAAHGPDLISGLAHRLARLENQGIGSFDRYEPMIVKMVKYKKGAYQYLNTLAKRYDIPNLSDNLSEVREMQIY